MSTNASTSTTGTTPVYTNISTDVSSLPPPIPTFPSPLPVPFPTSGNLTSNAPPLPTYMLPTNSAFQSPTSEKTENIATEILIPSSPSPPPPPIGSSYMPTPIPSPSLSSSQVSYNIPQRQTPPWPKLKLSFFSGTSESPKELCFVKFDSHHIDVPATTGSNTQTTTSTTSSTTNVTTTTQITTTTTTMITPSFHMGSSIKFKEKKEFTKIHFTDTFKKMFSSAEKRKIKEAKEFTNVSTEAKEAEKICKEQRKAFYNRFKEKDKEKLLNLEREVENLKDLFLEILEIDNKYKNFNKLISHLKEINNIEEYNKRRIDCDICYDKREEKNKEFKEKIEKIKNKYNLERFSDFLIFAAAKKDVLSEEESFLFAKEMFLNRAVNRIHYFSEIIENILENIDIIKYEFFKKNETFTDLKYLETADLTKRLFSKAQMKDKKSIYFSIGGSDRKLIIAIAISEKNDGHNKGKSVAFVKFYQVQKKQKSEIGRLVYKPRDSSLDQQIIELFRKINNLENRSFKTELPVYKIINLEDKNASFWEYIEGITFDDIEKKTSVGHIVLNLNKYLNSGIQFFKNSHEDNLKQLNISEEEFKILEQDINKIQYDSLKILMRLDDILSKLSISDQHGENVKFLLRKDKSSGRYKPSIICIDLENRPGENTQLFDCKIEKEKAKNILKEDNKELNDEEKKTIEEFKEKIMKITSRYIILDSDLLNLFSHNCNYNQMFNDLIESLKNQKFIRRMDDHNLRVNILVDIFNNDISYFTYQQHKLFYGPFPLEEKLLGQF